MALNLDKDYDDDGAIVNLMRTAKNQVILPKPDENLQPAEPAIKKIYEITKKK